MGKVRRYKVSGLYLIICAVYMQNHILQALLPHYGVLFVPMFVPGPVRPIEDLGYSKSIAGRRDCLRYEFGSILEEIMRSSLLRGMSFVMEGIAAS